MIPVAVMDFAEHAHFGLEQHAGVLMHDTADVRDQRLDIRRARVPLRVYDEVRMQRRHGCTAGRAR